MSYTAPQHGAHTVAGPTSQSLLASGDRTRTAKLAGHSRLPAVSAHLENRGLLTTPRPNVARRLLRHQPNFDVTETKDAFLFKADVPGVKKDDLEITTTGNRIQISGKRDIDEEKKSDTVYTYERQYGSFTRSFTLPAGADIEHAKSGLKDGVLTLVVPKLAEAQSKKIPISSGAKS